MLKGLPEKSQVLTDKRVTAIQQSSTEVTVQCLDGSKYTGDIVIGADGVHSVVRTEMWRLMIKEQPDILNAEENSTCIILQDCDVSMLRVHIGMRTKYRGAFGISSPVSGIREGDAHNVFGKGFSLLVVGCKDHLFWILGVDTGKTCYFPEVTLDKLNMEQDLQPFMGKHASSDVLFADVYKRTIRASYVPLEEGMFEQWSNGRIACIGDSVHKV